MVEPETDNADWSRDLKFANPVWLKGPTLSKVPDPDTNNDPEIVKLPSWEYEPFIDPLIDPDISKDPVSITLPDTKVVI